MLSELHTLAQSLVLASDIRDLIVPIAVAGGVLIAITGIVMGTIRQTASLKEREQTKREIAAYVAERSISPEEGERLMRAATARRESMCCGDEDGPTKKA